MNKPLAATRSLRSVALVGNPNVGKSTLFNALTGGRQRTANFAGVTVDAQEGSSPDGALTLVDLPGSYGLRPAALDDAVVARVLGEPNSCPDRVVVVLDANQLRRSLYLLSEVLDLGLPTVIALNMVDEARRAGLDVPTERLAAAAGTQVVETVATTGEGVSELRALIDGPLAPTSRVWQFADQDHEQKLAQFSGKSDWDRLQALLEDDAELRTAEVEARYSWINEVLTDTRPTARKFTERLDSLLLHPFLGPVVFLATMAALFISIFLIADPMIGWIEELFGWLAGGVEGTPVVGDLLANGVIAGVGSVVVFVPQIAILFLLIGLLEDTGYMARAAFLVDRPLRAMGLSGRSFIPLLSSYACAVPGVMATRTIPNRFERLLAIFVAPLMTCSARYPVYVMLLGVLFPGDALTKGLAMFGLYTAGLAAGAVIAFFASRSSRRQARGRELPLVVELPPYRSPTLKGMWLKLKTRLGDFLKRAGTVVFAISVVLWFLTTYPAEGAASYAGQISDTLEWSGVLTPMGVDGDLGLGILASFAAREVFVSTLAVVYAVPEGPSEVAAAAVSQSGLSKAASWGLLVFYVFALQCGATVAVVKQEAGSWRFALGQLVAFGLLAYVGAVLTYQLLSLAGLG